MTTFLINSFSFNKISVGAKNTWGGNGRERFLANAAAAANDNISYFTQYDILVYKVP